MTPTIRDEPPLELEDVRAGRLPGRYDYRMQDVFLARLSPLLEPGVRILDIGAGRAPTLAPESRPVGTHYAGLDISAAELEAAPAGAYDETYVHDITRPLPDSEAFDVAISWQVLEHVGDVGAALESVRQTLRPGGKLLAQLSGSAAAFSVAARVLPHRVRAFAMARWLGHDPREKFPVRHAVRTANTLERWLEPWSEREIIPFYRGATYFATLRVLQRAYLAYESALERRQARNLATHYLIIAER